MGIDPTVSPSRGCLRDCEIFGNLRITFVQALVCSVLLANHITSHIMQTIQARPVPAPPTAKAHCEQCMRGPCYI